MGLCSFVFFIFSIISIVLNGFLQFQCVIQDEHLRSYNRSSSDCVDLVKSSFLIAS